MLLNDIQVDAIDSALSALKNSVVSVEYELETGVAERGKVLDGILSRTHTQIHVLEGLLKQYKAESSVGNGKP